MADYAKAFEYLMELEGFLSNHPHDPGGLTAYGITKKFHPEMFAHGVPSKADAFAFYEREYWRGNGCHLIRSQKVANELFESSVLSGKYDGARFLQMGFNLVRPVGASALTTDGKIGIITAGAVNTFTAHSREWENALYRAANHYQALDLVAAHNKNPQGDFLRGWFAKRLD